MRQNLFLHSLLLASMLIRGETRSNSHIPGSPQDGAAVGLLLHNEKCVNDSTQSTTKAATEKTSKEFISVKSSVTYQPTTDSIADITGQPFTYVQSSATNQPTHTTNHSGLYLYEASARGDLAFVNAALAAAGTNLNWENPNNLRATPLHAAAQFNHSDVVTALLNAGAEKDIQDDNGMTPLYSASSYGSIDAVTVLVARGAIVDISNNNGDTALHRAALWNYPAIASALLDAGADRDRQDDDGATPLYYASSEDSIDVVNILIARGADVNTPHNDGTTPVAIASWMGYLPVVETLVADNADVNIPNEDGLTALHQAALQFWGSHNRLAIASVLLHGGASASAQDNQGRTPAAVAQEERHQELADFISMHGLKSQIWDMIYMSGLKAAY